MIDLRSDTVTKLTDRMRQVMFEAEVGDDVYRDDPTMRELEEIAAKKLGKEEALFVTSGTQGNQIAVLVHCSLGEEIILEEGSHIFRYEGGATSAFAGIQPFPIKGERGMMSAEDVEAAIKGSDIHEAETGLICLENTHNRAGGTVTTPKKMKEIYDVAQRHHIPIHLDGARLMNAAVALKRPMTDFTQYVTTVQICLSKGLGAPVGSIIAGSSEFIAKARKWRKRLGGGLRQAGVLAAPGIVALTEMVDRLEEDHQHAAWLAEQINALPRVSVVGKVETNILMMDVSETGHTANEFVALLKENGILANAFAPTIVRLVTHYDVSKKDIEETADILKQLIAEKCVK
ncbi:low-specificity L-threonine aldolase [Alkalicoccobacillus porphyridii]|uniref:Low-specificity L-threonine aldolase n=1 Tax=Alkalicoccobacillus porphyridii TaxID=2597270 RepID=A0A553ZVH4_9BACI|nr:low-specificity L-threonine aldolase [Alkalicoccobacillus porphyridii]TSB45423.1 low-specificity L-threonine aldolase [Alkalicoccobacillus porphyridii]